MRRRFRGRPVGGAAGGGATQHRRSGDEPGVVGPNSCAFHFSHSGQGRHTGPAYRSCWDPGPAEGGIRSRAEFYDDRGRNRLTAARQTRSGWCRLTRRSRVVATDLYRAGATTRRSQRWRAQLRVGWLGNGRPATAAGRRPGCTAPAGLSATSPRHLCNRFASASWAEMGGPKGRPGLAPGEGSPGALAGGKGCAAGVREGEYTTDMVTLGRSLVARAPRARPATARCQGLGPRVKAARLDPLGRLAEGAALDGRGRRGASAAGEIGPSKAASLDGARDLVTGDSSNKGPPRWDRGCSPRPSGPAISSSIAR